MKNIAAETFRSRLNEFASYDLFTPVEYRALVDIAKKGDAIDGLTARAGLLILAFAGERRERATQKARKP